MNRVFLFLLFAVPAYAQRGEPPCLQADIHHVPCVANITYSKNYVTSVTTTPGALPLPLWLTGSTSAEVEANFPNVINTLFALNSVAVLNAQIAVASDVDLARMSQLYYVESKGNATFIANLRAAAAAKLSTTNLARFNNAFGGGTAIIPESHAHWQSQGYTLFTSNGLASGLATPNVGMSMYEIYTEYLFTEAETELGAFAMAAKFVSVQLYGSFMIGYKAGTVFYGFMESIDPDYGYDLTTQYGAGYADFGPVDNGLTGTGYIDGPIVEINATTWNYDAD